MIQSRFPDRATVAAAPHVGALRLSLLLSLLLQSACESSTQAPVPAALAPVPGPESVQVTSTLPLAVRVLDATGAGVSGVETEWEVLEGGGQLSSTRVLSDADGIARTTWTVGTVAGEGRVRVGAGGLSPVTLTVRIDPGPVAEVWVQPEFVTFEALGEEIPLEAEAVDQWGNRIPAAQGDFQWTTSNPDVALVSGVGRVTPVGPGEAVVTASLEGRSGEAGVLVAQRVWSVEIDPDEAFLASAGQEVQFEASARDRNGHPIPFAPDAFTWMSSNPEVAAISGDGLATAAGPGSTTITATRDGVTGTATLTVSSGAAALFRFGTGVDAGSREVIEAGVALGDQALPGYGFPRVRGPVKVEASGSLEEISQWYASHFQISLEQAREVWSRSTAVAGPGAIFVFVGSQGWQNASTLDRRKTMVHEWFHIAQSEVSGRSLGGRDDEVPPGGPRWLTEGSAELFAFRILGESGALDYDARLAQVVAELWTRNPPEPSTLEDWNGMSAFSWSYPLSWVAADFLVDGAGLESLHGFYSAVADRSWEEAFAVGFGAPVGDFYEDFRANGPLSQPPAGMTSLSGEILLPSGGPASDIHVYACATTAEGAPCGHAVSDGTGRFRVLFPEPPGARRVQFGNTSDGCHPFGFFGAQGFTANPAQAAVVQVEAEPVALPPVTLPDDPSALPELNMCG
jgi:hypothetical protein